MENPQGIWLETVEIEVGEVVSGEIRTLDFPFEVQGHGVVMAKVDASCGCLNSRLVVDGEILGWGTALAAGTQGIIQVDWDTAKEAAELSIRTLINYVDLFMVLPGDCNGDGDVNILDVVALAGAILGNLELTSSQGQAADLDGNGLLNILDIIAIVNLILAV